MTENLKLPVSKYVTVVSYDAGNGVTCRGSKRREGEEIHVHWERKYKGKVMCATCTTCLDEESVKLFFYDKLQSELEGSWLIMRTLVNEEAEVFHAQMKAIEQQIPAAVIKKYEEILGLLENVTQQVIDKAVVNLQVICDGWHSKENPNA